MKAEHRKAFARHALVIVFICAALVLLLIDGHASFNQFLAFVGAFITGVLVVKLEIGKV